MSSGEDCWIVDLVAILVDDVSACKGRWIDLVFYFSRK